ncbi:hypothetical protein DPMN_068872 [Dreissena polymorpha]|uniref:Uncharacterized protein n=1 Tax=Dreissena polymorpha TaxID=45954 RepID=A0A9D3Z385_DREPO|nr:hypothetical protein DPMN_068872 [Dreissena polymorpha]
MPSFPRTILKYKTTIATHVQDPTGSEDRPQQEELDFMFDEEMTEFEGVGRRNNFTEW